MNKAKVLRDLMKEPGAIVAPGVYNAYTARLVEQAGFQAVYMTGSGTTLDVFGGPDKGLLTMTEMVSQAKNINLAVSLPVIADADTGYGNALNVIRTVREYERAGIAAIHIEDQVTPKRCGHFEGKELVSKDEMVGKIKAALDARENPESIIIIGRTDARSVLGFDETVRRAQAYSEAGAEAILVEGLESLEEYKICLESVKAPLMTGINEGTRMPYITTRELERLGFKIIVFATSLQRAAMKAVQEVLQVIKETGITKDYLGRIVTREERDEISGRAQYEEWEMKYLSSYMK
jgi:carboxyvinyl-carboxyphosphonate phosphorylmutase